MLKNHCEATVFEPTVSHASAEIKKMDRVQFSLLSSAEKQQQNQSRLSPILEMTDMWGPCRDGGMLPEFFLDQKAWRSWLRTAREVTMKWEGFNDWDWEGLKGIRKIGISKLPKKQFTTLAVRLLAFFINSFVTRLGYYPSPMLCPLILANHSCAKHRKKFATGLL